VAHFAALLPGPTPDVLDAGCGAGRMLPVLAAAGCRAVGVDLSAGMVRRARQDHPGFDTRVGSLTALPFPDGSFDGVLSWYSTIHLPDERLPPAVGEVRRVLRPGGHVLVAFQVGEGVRDVSQGYRRLGHDVTLSRHDRTPDHVAGALRAAGFTEVARLVRAPAGAERAGQAVLVARLVTPRRGA
jgi:SAM-dependent methyltransferase